VVAAEGLAPPLVIPHQSPAVLVKADADEKPQEQNVAPLPQT